MVTERMSNLTTIISSSDNRWHGVGRVAIGLPVLITALLCASPSLLFAQAPSLNCQPKELYRGDTLTVDLPMPHGTFDFAIWGPAPEGQDPEEQVVSFKPEAKDKIGPVISPGVFAKMKQIKLVTTEVRGSVFHPWQRPDGPVATGPPKPIFTQSGAYEVLLGGDLGNDDGDFDGCWVYYFDYPRPKGAVSGRSP